MIAREGLLISKGTPAYHDLCQMLQRAALEALTRAAERDAGQWGGRPADEAITPPAPSVAAPSAAPGETIMDFADRFAREKAGNASPDNGRRIGRSSACLPSSSAPGLMSAL